MRPYYSNPYCEIYLGDFNDVLPKLWKDKPFDLVITDPHYGVFEDGRDALDLDYIPLCYDCLKDGGAIFSFASQKRMWDFLNAFRQTKFEWKNTIVWHYRNGFSRESKRFVIQYDPILLYAKGDFSINTDDVRVPYRSTERLKYAVNNSKKTGWRPNPKGARRGDVWEFPAVTSPSYTKEKLEHGWQKPIELIKVMVLAGSNKDDVICDPFLGSGTTIIAAMQLGRKSVGIEIDEKYAEMSALRAQEYLTQMGNLFTLL